MPRVHFVKKAAKDHGDIKKGESYYWWKFNYGPLCRSKTPPTPSQLTRSEFTRQVLEIEQKVAAVGQLTDPDDVEGAIEDIKSAVEDLRGEQEEKLENLPDNFKEAEVGTLLQDRFDALDSAYDSLEAIETEKDEDESFEDFLSGIVGELGDISFTP